MEVKTMIREIFDVPDGSDSVLARAELFLRERIEELGGRLLQKLTAHDFGEYPSFEAQFDVTDPDMTAEGSQEGEEVSRERAELYKHLDFIQELYAKQFAKYL